MEILLCITLWLLSGFLAAWLGHKYVHKEAYPTYLGDVIMLTIGGGFSLLVCAAVGICRSNFEYVTVFKAKEPK